MIRPICVAIIALLLLIISEDNVCAQENILKPKAATYSRKGDFRLNYADGQIGFPCRLKGTYDREKGNYRLDILPPKEAEDEAGIQLMTLSSPLNYAYFHSAFNQAISKHNNVEKRLDDNSVQAVFNMLYTLGIEDQDDNVLSGDLWLKCWVMRFNTNPASDENKRLSKGENTMERERIADALGGKYRGYQAYISSVKNSIDTQLSRGLIEYTAKFDSLVNDTLKALADQNKTAASVSSFSEKSRIASSDFSSLMHEVGKRTKQINEKSEELKKVRKAIELNVNLDSTPTGNASESAEKKKQLDEERILDSTIKVLEAEKTNLKKDSTKYDSISKIAYRRLTEAKEEHKANTAKFTDAKDKLFNEQQKALSNASLEESEYRSLIKGWEGGLLDDSLAFYTALDNIKEKFKSTSLKPFVEKYFSEKRKFDSLKKQLADLNIFSINRISLQFERGYLERIQVWVDNGHGEDIFENIYAIGMSSISNYKRFSDLVLYIRKSTKYCNEYVYLSDVVGNYDNFLAGLTRDYSPADTAINNIAPCSNPHIMLRKERLVNLFDARIYTDLAGLRADQPNGLVQIEAARRFNIYTHRIQVKRADYSFANYLNAYGALTKVEQDQRYLPLRNAGVVQNDQLISPSYATNLDFRQYENFSVGATLNLFLFDWPDAKFTIFADVGIRYGHTSVLDSVRNVEGGHSVTDTNKPPYNRDAHTFTWELPKVTVELFSEKRVGLTLSYQYNNTRLYSNNYYKQIVSYAKSDLTAIPVERQARFSHMYEMSLRVETSRNGNGRMFLRARYYKQQGDANTFFPQIQLGYAYNLIFRK